MILYSSLGVKEAVVGIFVYEEKVVLGKKKKGEKWFSGRWHFPGETLKEGETDGQGLCRGAREELGLTAISIIRMLTSHISPNGIEVRWYLCQIFSDNLIPGSDLEEVKLIPTVRVEEEYDKEALTLIPEEINLLIRRWRRSGASRFPKERR